MLEITLDARLRRLAGQFPAVPDRAAAVGQDDARPSGVRDPRLSEPGGSSHPGPCARRSARTPCAGLFVVHLLPLHHRNFSKRVIKSPKLYFPDTGLLCNLLRIQDPEQIALHANRGAILETFVIGEYLKAFVATSPDRGRALVRANRSRSCLTSILLPTMLLPTFPLGGKAY